MLRYLEEYDSLLKDTADQIEQGLLTAYVVDFSYVDEPDRIVYFVYFEISVVTKRHLSGEREELNKETYFPGLGFKRPSDLLRISFNRTWNIDMCVLKQDKLTGETVCTLGITFDIMRKDAVYK